MERVTVDTYNQMAKEYDEETADFWERFPMLILQEFKKSLPNKGRVLDLGSGPGRDGLLLREAGLEVVCLDASKAMVGLTKEKGLKSVLADFNEMPFSDKSFVGLWAYTSLIHIPKFELPQVLKEAKRVLKVGGVLGLGLIEGDTEGYIYSSGISLPRYFAFYSQDEVTKILKSTGFDDTFYFEEFKPKSRNYLNFLTRVAL